MAFKEIQFKEKRDLGDVITDSFVFLKQEFKPLAKIILIYVAPFLALFSVGQVFIQQKLMGTVIPADPEGMLSSLLPIYKNMFFFLLFNVFVQSLYIGAVYSYIEVYIKKGKGNFAFNDVTPLLFHNSLLALAANILTTAIVCAGLIMCFLPGVYFANTLSLTVICMVFEKKGIGFAFSRSWKLVNYQWWGTLLLNILGIAILWVVSFILSLPTVFAGITANLISIGAVPQADLPHWFWVVSGANTFLTSFLYVILFTFWAFQYFNIEERVNPASLPPAEV